MTTNTDRIIRDAMIPGEASNGLCLAQLAELNCWSEGVTVTQRPGTPVPVVAYSAGTWYVTNRADDGPRCATAAEAIAAWNRSLA